MSRRNTYLIGGLTAVAGIAMLVFAIVALTSGGGDSGSGGEPDGAAQPTAEAPAPTPGGSGAPGRGAQGTEEPSGTNARGADVSRDLAARRLVRAPSFSAEVIQAGLIPQALRRPFERATRGGFDISELRGTPVVLHVWSSECSPCRGGTRLVEASWKRWGPRGVLFMGVHVNESAGVAAEPVLRQYDLTYPAVWDRSDQITKRYGVSGLPQMFFISASGDIVGEVVGAPSVRQLELGTAAANSGEPFGSEQGTTRLPLR
jgi:cytochrome c biogenesis protein CcmG/thiol:disulfide interchange protein DsbE